MVRPPRGTRRTASCHLILGMTDRDVVERFHAIMGCGNVYRIRPTEKSPGKKDQWRWEIGSKRDSLRVTEMFLPFLGERRAAKAREIIVAASQPDGRSLRRQ